MFTHYCRWIYPWTCFCSCSLPTRTPSIDRRASSQIESTCFPNISLLHNPFHDQIQRTANGLESIPCLQLGIECPHSPATTPSLPRPGISIFMFCAIQVISARDALSGLIKKRTWSLNMRSIVSSNNLRPRSSAYFVASWEIKKINSLSVSTALTWWHPLNASSSSSFVT